jgi:hypothetical protein
MSTRYETFQIRRGSSADFAAANTLLASGEPAYAIDTKIFKIGDGVTRWNTLRGITGDLPVGIASENYVLNAISGVIDSAPDMLNTLNELAAALSGDANFATTIVSSLNQKANLAGGNTFTGYNIIPSGSGNFNILSISGVGVSVFGHSHLSSDITNFNTSVSGLVSGYYALLNGANFTGSISSPSGSFTNSLRVGGVNVSVSGHTHVIGDITNLQTTLDNKQPSGSYAAAIHSHVISDVTGLQSALDGKQASGSYAALSHTHTASNITDFSSSVSGLLPVKNVIGSGYVNVISTTGNYTVSVTGLQPSGSYAASVHTHVISDVTGLQSALDLKAPLANPTFTGTVSGISKSMVGLGNVDNTSDASKPISTATQTALDNKAALSHTHTASNITDFNTSVSGLVNGIYAPLSSPTLTGVPLAPTASSGTNTNQIASTSFVRTEISNLVSSAPSTLDTLNELATALGNDPNFATTVTNNLANKAALSGATFTGLISSPSGSFSQNLKVNGTNVSVSGHSHSISDVTGLQTALDSKQPSGNYAASSHTHTASQITDFNTSVSGLVNGIYAPLASPTFTGTVNGISKSMVGLGNVDNTSDANKPVSTATQTALDGKAALSHTHTSSNITDFNSSVSGLLPVTSIIAGSNITISSTAGAYTINSTGSSGGGGSSVSNYGTNRVLLSDNTLSGIVAQTNLTFDGSILKVNNVNVSISGHNHIIGDVTGLQTALDGKQASGNYAASSHTHTASQISDSTTAGRALLTSADAAAQRTSLGLGTLSTQSGTFSGTSSGTNTGDQTISISGDVTAAGSTGSLSATVTKINGTLLSGLATGLLKNTTSTGIPSIAVAGTDYVANIVAGTNITVSGNAGMYTINSTASGGGTTIANSGVNRVLISDGSTSGISAQSNLTFNGSLLTAPSGSFANNLAIGSNNLTPTNTLNAINSTNLYLWSSFR